MANITEAHNDLTGLVIGTAIDIHRHFGPGLLESVYEEALCYRLGKEGIAFEKQKEIPVYYDEQKMGIGFRADLIIAKQLIVEIKSVEQLAPVHAKQLMTYLRLTGLSIGLLINFNEELLKNGIKRIVM